MLANFFGKSKPVNFLVLFALFLGYFFLTLLSKDFSIELFKELFWFVVVFSVFNFIITKNQLTFDNSYAFLFFVILIGCFHETIHINNLFFANLTILLFLRKVYSLQSSKNILHKCFDGGLWLGISFLIEPFTAMFGILLYISIYLHQRITYQTIFAPIVGFLPPVFLYFTYCFWYDKTEQFDLLFNLYSEYNFEFYSSIKYLLPIIIVIVFTLFSLFLKTPKTLAIKNTFRKNWILILIHTVIATILVLALNKNINELLFLFFPVSVVLTNGIELVNKKWLVDIIITSFVTLSFLYFFI